MDIKKQDARIPRKRKKASVNQSYCVACGVCANHCPKEAISITSGMYATVDEKQCIGCGKCARICPASYIDMVEIEVKGKGSYEKK